MPALPAPLPTEKLRDAVDLIVVPAVGKGQKLVEKLAQPGRVPGKEDSSRLEIRQLSLGARCFIRELLLTFSLSSTTCDSAWVSRGFSVIKHV